MNRDADDVTEQAIVDVFTEVLHANRPVRPEDSFFDLGGDSLVATKVVARFERGPRVTLTVRDLFEAPTAHRLAGHVGASRETDGATDAPVPILPLARPDRPARLPLSPAQQRMWFVNQLDTGSPVYNIAFAVTLTGQLDVAALRAAIGDVVERHEALRTVFPGGCRRPPTGDRSRRVGRAGRDTGGRGTARGMEQIRRVSVVGFDVREEPPLRAQLFRLGPEEHVLAVVVHHIAADGQSVSPLARDVMVAYAARRAGGPPRWTPLPVQYADYALWQRDMLGDERDGRSVAARQLQYWTARLADLPPAIALPHDRPRSATMTTRGATVTLDVGADTHRRLLDLGRECDCTLFMVLHAAFAALLARLGAGRDVAIGTPVAGRTVPELDESVGMFVNTLVLRTDVDPASTFVELLAVSATSTWRPSPTRTCRWSASSRNWRPTAHRRTPRSSRCCWNCRRP